jgi:hypothetical protein
MCCNEEVNKPLLTNQLLGWSSCYAYGLLRGGVLRGRVIKFFKFVGRVIMFFYPILNLPRCLDAQEPAEQAVFLLLQQQQTLVLPKEAQQQRKHLCC